MEGWKMISFIPDSGKYEIVSFICTCYGNVNLHMPLQRVAVEVAGWTQVDADYGETPEHLPLVPVILDLTGLKIVDLPGMERVGAPRLAKIGECTLTHQELIALHRDFHEED